MESTPIRLQKFLSSAGVCSRREAERHIQAGRIRVNGEVVREMGTRILPGTDNVLFDGQPVTPKKSAVYIILNKPAGYVTSCKSPHDETVLDLVQSDQRIFPVGRLDKQSTGLLLLTNDGRLHHRLSHPSFDHEKVYRVKTVQPLSDKSLAKMAKGVTLKGRRTRKAGVVRIDRHQFEITLKEGRNRQIRRMVGSVGGRVWTLKRIRFACLRLGSLAEGQWRFLTASETSELLNLTQFEALEKGSKGGLDRP